MALEPLHHMKAAAARERRELRTSSSTPAICGQAEALRPPVLLPDLARKWSDGLPSPTPSRIRG
eukprot:4926261-Prymnesium_polylepis.1